MVTNPTQDALLVAYTALCEATELATGKPVGEMSGFLIGGVLADVSPDVAVILKRMTGRLAA